MKIDNRTQGFVLPNQTAPSTAPAGGNAFKTHLEKAMVRTGSGQNPSLGVAATPSPGAVTSIIGASGNHQRLVQGLDDLLGALSTYQKRLGDARFDLKTLEQDLNGIEAHCRQMDDWLEHASVDDALRGMLREGLATARIEIERFYGGEYC